MRVSRFERVERGAVIVTVALTALAVWRPALASFAAPKITLLVLGVIVIGVVAAVRAGVSGELAVPTGPLAIAVGAFVVAALLATVSSDRPVLSFLGDHDRRSGFLLYASCAVLLVSVQRLFDREQLGALGAAAAATAGVVGAYGLVQWLGLDPYGWVTGGGVVISTLGNPNFLAGFLAICLPLAAWGALRGEWSVPRRLLAGLAGLVAVAALLATGSSQGPVAGGAGLAVMALAWLRDGTERLRVMGTRLWAVGTTLAAALAVLGIAGAGPLAGLGAQAGVELRLHYWQAALGMVGAEPLTGVGLDRYGAYFREYRSDAAVAALSGEIDVDAAHSVPLNLLAGGGLPLGLAYLAVVLAVGWMLVRGLTRLWGAPLRLLGAFGGAWVAYQVQSLVSFDVAPLAVLGWVTAGAVVVAAGGAAVIDVRLPWWKTSVLRRGSGLLPHAPGLRLLVAGTLVLGGVAAVGALTPLYADVLGRAAAEARDTDPQRAIAAAERATGLAPWRPEYWREVGAAYLRAGLVEQAATALERGVRADPRHLALVLSAAGAAAAMGDEQRAAALYEQAVAIEPRAPDVLLEAAEFLAEAGRPERASDLVRTVLAFDPTNTKGLDLERELADASS